MVALEALVECIDEKYFIKIKVEDKPVVIPLSEDNPSEVKSAFNSPAL